MAWRIRKCRCSRRAVRFFSDAMMSHHRLNVGRIDAGQNRHVPMICYFGFPLLCPKLHFFFLRERASADHGSSLSCAQIEKNNLFFSSIILFLFRSSLSMGRTFLFLFCSFCLYFFCFVLLLLFNFAELPHEPQKIHYDREQWVGGAAAAAAAKIYTSLLLIITSSSIFGTRIFHAIKFKYRSCSTTWSN